MIILLGLNFTLIKNSEEKKTPFLLQIENEQYRQDLIETIKEEYVILVTARPLHYMDMTLNSILAKTKWQPDEWFFNTGLTPPLFAEMVLNDHIYQEHGKEVELLSIENNEKVQAMYNKYGICSLAYLEYMSKYGKA